MAEVRSMSMHVRNNVLHIAGMATSTYLGVDLYSYMLINQLIIDDLGEEFVSQEFAKEGKDWKRFKLELKRVEKKVIAVKAAWDIIEDKLHEKKGREEREKMDFKRKASKIKIIDNPIIKLHGWLVRKTDLQRFLIPRDAYKILEHAGFKKIEMTKKTDEQKSESASSGEK